MKHRRILASFAPALVALLLLSSGCNSGPSREQKEQMIEMHTELALGYYRMGELERAEGQALKGLELSPQHDMLQLVLAWTLQRKGSTQDVLRAESIFRKLSAKNDYRAELGLAQALERKGQAFSEASEKIVAGAETDAADPEQRARELAANAGEAWRDSTRHYNRTLELHPQDRDALNGLQRVTALLGQFQESLQWSQELVDLIEAEIEFWETRLQQPDLSANEEQRFVELVGNGRDLQLASFLQQASVLHTLDRPRDELEPLTRALEIDPTRPDLFGRRAQVYMELESFDAALRDLDEFLRLTPEGFDHPDTRLAYELRSTCQLELAGTP